MAEPKTRPTDQPVSEFIAALPDERKRADCQRVTELMQEASGVAPRMWGSAIIGFGAYLFTPSGGKPTEWPVLAFSPRKTDLTLYVLTNFKGQEDLLARLGKHKTGKVCLYLKKLADVDEAVLRQIIAASLAHMTPQRVA
ncbi:DUF1801 domain-containing protein [Pelomonas sp. SE-A7]|uniref:DUF1801 domain-containing protein n=1 Tax=Pelomonas sp. SE-A7 TaxID=3054953 RepID=UPI00259CB2DF|nr:DUF1801 domain-containing protein [Pelomonas sp. SE-A7]MDM4766501.1 DUF1801 domain-containing protein [Pelomonas sp. SE-A7]